MYRQSFILVVQGEGRGHLMQALTVSEILRNKGHEICCVVVGRSEKLLVPDFFTNRIQAPVVCLPSPGFIKSGRRSINLWRTFFHVCLHFSEYVSSIRRLHCLICFHRPHTLINFYEPLAGLHGLIFPRMLKRVSIAHQYVYLHHEYTFTGTSIWNRLLLQAFTRLTAFGSDKLLALSIFEMSAPRSHRLRIVPPILRGEVLSKLPCNKGFILIYLVYSGYMKDIIDWHQKNPTHQIHCFTDDMEVLRKYKRLYKYDERLWFHSIDDRLFLEMMASSSCVVTTAGFETVCEALLLGKPLLMVPVDGHQEQQLNALEAQRSGLAHYCKHYHIENILNQPPISPQFHLKFKSRVKRMHHILLQELSDNLPMANTRFENITPIANFQAIQTQP